MILTWSDATARDIVLSEISQNLCAGLTAAKKMSIHDIVPTSAFHVIAPTIDLPWNVNLWLIDLEQYTLETCTETRTASWVHEPFTGQLLDSADHGTPPKPWDVNSINNTNNKYLNLN